jgi:hypothetical protein
MEYSGPALKAVPSAPGGHDFVDIPAEGNDWGALNEEFFAGIRDPGAYHPWPLPGIVEGEAYRADSGLAIDSVAVLQSEAATFKAAGAWAEYFVTVEAAATLTLDFRYLADAPAGLRILDDRSGTAVPVDLPVIAAWGEAKAELHLEAGAHVLRIESVSGTFGFDRFRATVK